MLIEVKNVSYTYSRGTPFARQGLKEINLAIGNGEWLVVMGPTGSGKSTLMQHLNGLIKPDTGSVMFKGVNIHSSRSILRDTRKRVGLVFQYPEHQIFGASVLEEVSYGPGNHGHSPQEAEDMGRLALERVGLDFAAFRERVPHTLSGGEKRRVALAGVLAMDPEVIILDEPTAGLDPHGKRKLVEVIARLNKELRKTVVWVTHEITEISSLADRLLVLNSGQLVIDGEFRETVYNPLMEELKLDIPLTVGLTKELEIRGRVIAGRPVGLGEIQKEILKMMVR